MNFLRMLSVLMVVVILMAALTEAGPLLRGRGRGGSGRRGGVPNGISPIYGDTYANFINNNGLVPGVFNQLGFLGI